MIVEYLNSEGHLYSTIDDDHYKYTQNAADSVSNSSNKKKNKTYVSIIQVLKLILKSISLSAQP
jgi:hypothetical protein